MKFQRHDVRQKKKIYQKFVCRKDVVVTLPWRQTKRLHVTILTRVTGQHTPRHGLLTQVPAVLVNLRLAENTPLSRDQCQFVTMICPPDCRITTTQGGKRRCPNHQVQMHLVTMNHEKEPCLRWPRLARTDPTVFDPCVVRAADASDPQE